MLRENQWKTSLCLGNAKIAGPLLFQHDYQEKLEELEKEAKQLCSSVDGQLKGLLALQDIPKENAKASHR